MSLVSKADPKLKSLYIGLLSWHYDRKNDAELREMVQQFIASQSEQPHIHLLSDASLSDEAFASLLDHTCDLLMAREQQSSVLPDQNIDSAKNIEAVKLELGGRPVAALEDEDEEDDLVSAKQTLPEPDRSGIDWVSVFYGLDGLIARFSLGWLSIGRVIGLTCVAAVLGMPFYLEQKQPLSWHQLKQMITGEDPTPRTPGGEVNETKSESFASSAEAEVPPSIAAMDRLMEGSLSQPADSTNGAAIEELVIIEPSLPENEPDKTASIPDQKTSILRDEGSEPSQPLSTELPTDESGVEVKAGQEDAAMNESDNSVRLIFGGVPTARDSQVSFDRIVDLVKNKSFTEAIEQVDLVRNQESYDPCIADLIKFECYLQQKTPEARQSAWQVIAQAETQSKPALYELQAVRWLLTSTRAERATLLSGEQLPADSEFADRLMLWTEARSGSKEADLLSRLREHSGDNSQSVGDHMFLANAYYASGAKELALEELIATRQLLSSMAPIFTSDSVQWLVAQSKSDIEKRVVGPIQKIAVDLGPHFQSTPND